MRFVDAKTGSLAVPKITKVHYYWQWLEWPYAEHSSGVWSDAEDWVKCSTGADGQIVIPARIITPFGCPVDPDV